MWPADDELLYHFVVFFWECSQKVKEQGGVLIQKHIVQVPDTKSHTEKKEDDPHTVVAPQIIN